jgi:hypothetical protein
MTRNPSTGERDGGLAVLGADPRWAAPALLLVVALAHAGALRAGFVWDDTPLLLRNTLLGDPAALGALLSGDLWAGAPVEDGRSGYYRPLLMLDYSVDVALFGLSAAWMHLRGLLWHLLAVAAAWRLARGLFAPWPAAVAALIFGLHPVQVEAVTWIAARNDPMAAALGGWALVAAARPTRGAAVGAGLLSGLALLTKESALLLPALHLAWVWARGGTTRAALPGARALVLGLLPPLSLRLALGVDGAGLPSAAGWALFGDAALGLAGLSAGLLLAPLPGAAGWALEYLDRAPAWRFGMGVLAIVLGAVALLRARPGLRGGALLWLAAAGAPPLLAVADKGLFGERYLYLGLIGVGWLVGAQLSARTARPAAALLALLGAVGLHARAPDWVDDGALWAASRAAVPTPYTAASAGHAHFLAGDLEGARAAFIVAIDDPEPWLDACAPLLATAVDQGRVPLGVQLAAWAALQGCDSPRFRSSQALLLAASGRWAEAERAVARAGGDPTGRAEVVRAALALRAGDEAAVQALEAGFVGAPPLRAQAAQLLMAAGGGEP